MKKLSRHFIGFTVLSMGVLLFYSCTKDTSISSGTTAGTNSFAVYLTDGPTDYQQVLIDIRGIAVKIDTCRRNGDDDIFHPGCDDGHDSLYHRCEIWDTLNIHPGVYDLLKFRNGLDTLLASGFLINGKIERIKITLGTNNSVMADSVLHPLQLLNNQNYEYVDIHREHLDSLSSNNLQLFLDFDLQRSILYMNGSYWLKPVLRPFGQHHTGEIAGIVRPAHSSGLIKAYNATDTAYALAWDEGEFMVRGLHNGTYSLLIKGINTFKDSTISNIIVQQNRKTDLGTILLHH